jgi:hypothetical protein
MLLHHLYCEIRRNPAWMRVVVALAAYPELDGKVLSWRNIAFALTLIYRVAIFTLRRTRHQLLRG